MAKNEQPRIWFCDLTYTQQTIASDIFPAGVGGIATYAERHIGRKIETRIFKYPERLAHALEEDPPPHIIAFANYIWNRRLSAKFAAVVKKCMPRVVTIFGGPNYPTSAAEQEAFMRAHPMIDFYIPWEGEAAFTALAEMLIEKDFEPARVPADLPSVHRIMPAGEFQAAPLNGRLANLSQIPSPYLAGKMDEFFDGILLPIIQTKRGCPFQCTFCVEGNKYYSKVAKSDFAKSDAEIRYIAEKMCAVNEDGEGRMDLHISDSNFGMFKDDLDICRTIAEMQERYDFPTYVNVATGKNHKERVLEAASLINGALRLAGSVQSLDQQVLSNIERSNIDDQGLMDLALAASAIGANSYSEIILGLPGDSVEAHLASVRKVIEADFNNISLYQLMLLPGTDLADKASIEKWAMQTRYRILPRCYGYYDCLGEKINAAEIEEICISNSSMSFTDYLQCRRFHLIISLFYNDGVFKEVLHLLRALGLSKYDWLERIQDYGGNPDFQQFLEEFVEETKGELWQTREEAETLLDNRDNQRHYLEREMGANLLYKYRSIALAGRLEAITSTAMETLSAMLVDTGNAAALDLGMELITYAEIRMTNIFKDLDRIDTASFHYAVELFENEITQLDLAALKFPAPREYSFELTEDQKKLVTSYLSIYDSTPTGLSRILSKIYMRRLFRQVRIKEQGSNNSYELSPLHFGNSRRP